MAILVQDSFTRSNSTTTLGTATETGQTWSALVGTWGITSNKAYSVDSSANAIAVIDSTISDATISINLTFGTSAGIAFRVVDGSNYFLARIANVGLQVYRFVAGSATSIGTYSFTPVGGTVYALKVICNGSNIKVYINDIERANITDTNYQTSTKHGLRNTSGDSTSRYDDFEVDSLSVGTIQNGASSVQGVSTITAAATIIPAAITGSSPLQGVSTVSATANIINAPMLGSASLPGVGMVTATASVIRSGSANMMGVSTLSAFAAGLTVPAEASLMGVSSLMATGSSGANISRIINLLASMAESIQLSAESAITINLQASWSNDLSLFGSNPDHIALEGGLMTKTKQDFTMYAGDTPPLTFTMTDLTNLSGATVKWGLRRGHVKGPQVLLKTSDNGGLSASGTVITVNLVNSDTFALDGQFYHEAEVTDISGKVSTIMTGNVTIQPSGV